MAVSLIIGVGGQDGQLLSALLKERGEEIWGVGNGWKVAPGGESIKFDLSDQKSVLWLIRESKPDRIFYLAAFHHASGQKELLQEGVLWSRSLEVHVEGWRNVLESVEKEAPHIALFYASSSLVFGNPDQAPQDESTALAPVCIYGITKTTGVHLGRFYREMKNLRVSIGFLYTHESLRRGPAFVAKKIVNELHEVREGRREQMILGDLSATVDWGFAPDFVDAMDRITSLDEGGDFIIATGETHTVGEFAEIVCRELGLDFRKSVREDSGRQIRKRRNLIGNSRKLREKTGWKPSVRFEEMVLKLTREVKTQMVHL
ncbi:MAG: GDP-mannose 4,6-dehydratase [Verrucomicrobiota bacterium]